MTPLNVGLSSYYTRPYMLAPRQRPRPLPQLQLLPRPLPCPRTPPQWQPRPIIQRPITPPLRIRTPTPISPWLLLPRPFAPRPCKNSKPGAKRCCTPYVTEMLFCSRICYINGKNLYLMLKYHEPSVWWWMCSYFGPSPEIILLFLAWA